MYLHTFSINNLFRESGENIRLVILVILDDLLAPLNAYEWRGLAGDVINCRLPVLASLDTVGRHGVVVVEMDLVVAILAKEYQVGRATISGVQAHTLEQVVVHQPRRGSTSLAAGIWVVEAVGIL